MSRLPRVVIADKCNFVVPFTIEKKYTDTQIDLLQDTCDRRNHVELWSAINLHDRGSVVVKVFDCGGYVHGLLSELEIFRLLGDVEGNNKQR